MLPQHPAARLGSAIHRLLEEAGRGAFATTGAAGVEQCLQELIQQAEAEIAAATLDRHLIPLRRAVADYEVRWNQARNRALQLTASHQDARPASTPHAPTTGYELPVSSSDGLVRGQIDAVVAALGSIVLQDYKSGFIYERMADTALAVKQSYQTQLRLYAALYHETVGRWPDRLEIVPIQGESVIVEFEPAACNALLDEATRTLREIEKTVATAGADYAERLATPSPQACGFCLYRPACQPYADASAASDQEPPWPIDTWGIVDRVVTLGNGRKMVVMHDEDGEFAIRGLSSEPSRHPALNQLNQGDVLVIFNLRSAGSDSTYSETEFTTMYRNAE